MIKKLNRNISSDNIEVAMDELMNREVFSCSGYHCAIDDVTYDDTTYEDITFSELIDKVIS